jgi:hypothetical protein
VRVNFVLTGLPAFIFLVGFVVVFSAPVWLAARIVGAKRPTLLHAAASLFVGMLAAFLLTILTGPWVFLLVPFAFLLSFKYVLGTSWLGSILLAVIAGLAYAAIGYLLSGTYSGGGNSIVV